MSMIVKDTHPFGIVEDVGFRAFVSKLDPNYRLPTRQVCMAVTYGCRHETNEYLIVCLTVQTNSALYISSFRL